MTTKRYKATDYVALMEGRTVGGRRLADIAEAAIESGREKNAQPASPIEQKTAIQPKARGRTAKREAGKMNGLELAYAENVLEPLKRAGEILEYWFERFTFKIADDCRYTPDFVVLFPDGLLQCRETKGVWEDDALVKIKVAAEMFPFEFIAIQRLPKKEGGGWKEREF